MSQSIIADSLQLEFTVPKKQPGLTGALKSFISPEYHTVKAVNDVSFQIGPGELVGFIGPNGAGKTTTLKMLSGLLKPSSGSISVLGQIPFARKTAFLKNISLILGQKNQLIWDLPATDTFLLNKAIYDIPTAEYKRIFTELVELLGVADQLQTPVRKLSLGQRMKMELIAALLHTPKVLFLDEPTIGLDVLVQRSLRDFIREYNRKHEATILLTSHYMGDVRELCSRVIIISSGRVLFDGNLNALIREHSPEKLIRVTFSEALSPDVLSKFGVLQEWNEPQAVIAVPRDKAASQAAKILERFNVSDLNIEETPIEDVIRDIYHGA